MRRISTVGASSLVIAGLLLASTALPVAAGKPAFGAKLNNTSQPANAEFGRKCSQSSKIGFGKNCTWVAETAYRNGAKYKAPKNGRIGKVKLVSCVKGSFRLQLARVKRAQDKAKIVRNGRFIKYKADPRQVDGNPDTFCGGEDGDQFKVQTFKTNMVVKKGEFIAIKTKRTGTLSCSGGSGTQLFSPVLPVGGSFRKAKDDMSCDMLVRLVYK